MQSLACLHLFGGFRLTTPSRQEVAPRAIKTRAMLAYLAMSPTGKVDRGQLSAIVWSKGADAKASLRQALREARQAFGPNSHDLLVADRLYVSLNLARIWVDALEVERLAGSASPQDCKEIARLCTGEFLEGFEGVDPAFDEWLLVERERLRREVLEAIEARLAIEPEDPDTRILATALLDLEPSHEAAHRALMRDYATHGETAAALRQYKLCRDILERDLDAAPSDDTEALLDEVKNGAIGREARASPQSGAAAITSRSSQALIAVEPKNLTLGNTADQSLAAALAAELRQALARIRWLSVVDSSLYFPPVQAGSRGGVTWQLPVPGYYVFVSVLRSDSQVRLTTELKDAESSRILWADHHDHGIADDIFSVVDTISGSLAGQLDQEVRIAETMRAARKPFETLSAYDCVLRAVPLMFELTPEAFAEAERLLLKGQEADPNDSMVYAWRAFWYSMDFGQGWVRDPDTAKAELEFLVRRSIECDPKNALALSVAGHIAAYIDHDYERALALFEQSLQLDPSSAYAWDSFAVTLCYAGQAQKALDHLEANRALWQQHPDPYYFHTTACIALLLAGRPDEAAALGRRTVRENPNFQAALRPLIASLGLTDQIEEAQKHLADLRRQHPDFSIGWFREDYPPLHGEAGQRYVEGLRKAGVGE